ncbi:MAG TPA: tRNA lysidine(34) synthetase TilS [Syntrophaceae bacterium]|jgi:tRNA(Ile)-lysidine synthase|nr:tRNA lysidine(34) synthetase TilS [Syntrophaceae bacterium]
MINKVKDAIQKYGMLKKGECIIVAVSGGPDSIALLKVLALISEEYEITLITAHLNHGLRKEADYDEQLVLRISREMEITSESRKVHINSFRQETGRSIEDISREVRYQFLNDVAKKYHANKIALGHNLNDQIETVLMNVLRGSGSEGLKGMLPIRDSLYIRPLLGISRKKILSFIESHKIQYVTDASNTENLYLRNRIRNSLIPQLKKYNPNLEENLKNMAEIMRLEDDYMKTVSRAIISDWKIKADSSDISISISELRKHHEAVQNQVIKGLLRQSTPGGQGIGYAHIKAVTDLYSSEHPSGYRNLPHGIMVRREYDSLIISKGMKAKRKITRDIFDNMHYEVTFPGSVKIAELGKTLQSEFVKQPEDLRAVTQNVVFMDYDTVVPPVIIRTIKPGDRIQPLGMQGEKKIKSYFIDEKVPIDVRKQTLLLLDQKSVIWIVGRRLSERVKISEETRRVLKVEIV